MANAWPPGPSGLRALTYLGLKREPLAFTERCAREFGGICGIKVPFARFCVISDPELLEQVFVRHASRIRKWDPGPFAPILGEGLLTSGGELWKRQRSLISPVFQPARIESYEPGIIEHTRATLASWPDDGVLDVHEEMLRLSMKIASGALFGADSSGIEGLVSDMHQELMTHFEDALSGVPVPMWAPTPGNLRVRRAIRALEGALFELISQRRRKAARPDGKPDLLGALLAAQEDPADPTAPTAPASARAPMSDKQLRDECMTMMLAGHETTALVLTWTLWLLARHPADVRALVEESASGGELTFHRDVINESMRLRPPVWATGRVAIEELDLGVHRIPKGTQIFLVPYLAHRDPAVFDEPAEFRPRRWQDPKIRAIPRCSFMPFGSGPRKCVGMHFASRELQLALAGIVASHELAPVPGDEPELQASVTLRPKRGLRLHVRLRKPPTENQTDTDSATASPRRP